MVDLNACENIARTLLKSSIANGVLTEEDIHEAVEKTALLLPMTVEEKKYLEKVIQSSNKVRMDLGTAVVKEATYHPWLSSRKASINPYYWNRYYKYLTIEEGWDEHVVDSLGEVSDTILDLCGDPGADGVWKRKGLILGDIQSGKTSNYLALCNKAADAGYKIIILLSGTIEGLRKQTQERVDSGFVGISSRNMLQKNPEKKFIGVGSIDSNRSAFPFTSIVTDFNSERLQALNFTIIGLPEPVILVVKKNKSILENLERWLRTRNTVGSNAKIDLPLLLIDDEADNASVNTNKPDQQVTAINGAIVNVLKLFRRSSYVAVTATPFANIFIDPDLDKGGDDFNLFPSDFIYALSAPTNYIGAHKIFDDDGECSDALESIDDVTIDINHGVYVFRSKDKATHIIPYLPESLKKAIRYFFLVNVARDLGGRTNDHRSMLANVSQFVNVQAQLYEMITEYVRVYKSKIQAYSKLPVSEALKHPEIKELQTLWKSYDLVEKTGHAWEDAQQRLYEAVMPIEIRLVNQKSKELGVERLDYEPYKESGLRVIAIGGNSLSRGLTLEGLCVSYFDRNSQMYDTLMQMGRWFGYRKGYESLFKIWMEPETISWYQYISQATDELKEEILEMRRVGLTPKDFGLKVQQNKNSLFVTARNKMRATTVVEQWISLAAEVIETPKLIANKEKCLEINLKLTNDLIKTLVDGSHRYKKSELNYEENRVVFSGVDKQIIADYIHAFVTHPRHIPFSSKDLGNHIGASSQHETWSVAIIGGKGGVLDPEYFNEEVLGLGVSYSKRVMLQDDNCLLISGQRARVGVPGATKYGLKEDERKEIETKYRIEHKDVQTIPDKPYLKTEREPILLIYLMKIDTEVRAVPDSTGKKGRKFDSDEQAKALVKDYPVIGLGLGFPGSSANENSEKVKYVLNRIGERELIEFEEDDEYDD